MPDTPYPSRPTACIIALAALKNNYLLLRRSAGKDCKLLAVVKADAYGHGAVPVSKELERLGVDFLGVAILEEAAELREAGIRSPILILGGLLPGQESALFDLDLTPMVFSLPSAERINAEALRRGKTASVHVKIDTGMGRLGITPGEVKGFFTTLKSMKGLRVEGVATHFSSADCRPDTPEAVHTKAQIELFARAMEEIESLGIQVPIRHAANSAALLSFPSPHFNMARPGLALYGASPFAGEMVDGLMGVMTFRTQIVEIKEIEKGGSVSYGRTFTATARRRIAVVPAGYADGYRRELSNRAEAIVRGKRARVAGRVCMDMTMIDVSEIDGAAIGDEVILFGGGDRGRIPVEETATLANTIPYEILCGISQRVPRVYTV